MAFRTYTWHLLICLPQVNVSIQSNLCHFCAFFNLVFQSLKKGNLLLGSWSKRFQEIFGKSWAVLSNGLCGKEPVSKITMFISLEKETASILGTLSWLGLEARKQRCQVPGRSLLEMFSSAEDVRFLVGSGACPPVKTFKIWGPLDHFSCILRSFKGHPFYSCYND